jgi:glycosyltransferase involved in cell wall biosynthesis
MIVEHITPLILTYNEAPNIDRTLQKLTWATQIVVIDSYSSDRTLEILAQYPQVKVFQRKFDSFAAQCNYGLSQVSSEWVLSLDADYVLSDHLVQILHTLTPCISIDSYRIPFKYCVFGKPLRGTLLPPRTLLYRWASAQYHNDGHSHKVQIQGTTVNLKSYILHDDRKPLSRWLWAQDRYMLIEAKKLLETPIRQLSWGDRIRRLKLPAPFVILVYCLILKGGILDGWPGIYYAFQRMLAEILLAIQIIEIERLNRQSVTDKYNQ